MFEFVANYIQNQLKLLTCSLIDNYSLSYLVPALIILLNPVSSIRSFEHSHNQLV